MRFLQSLYLRLVLVLLLALGASYGTMYVLFERHLEDTRDTHFARSVAAQVRLVEELLRSRPAADIAGLKGLRLLTGSPPAPGDALAGQPRLVQLQKHLAEELGHDVVVLPDDAGGTGMWVELRAAAAPTWMFVAVRKPRPRGLDPLGWALLAGFGVFLGGGMLLLWQLQRPLKPIGLPAEGARMDTGIVSMAGTIISRRLGTTAAQLGSSN
jgi:two-component system osmolarity sensor histidine kinase EnvZ